MAVPTVSQFSPRYCYPTVTVDISEDDDLSTEVDLRGTQLVGVFTPANFDSTSLVIYASPTAGGTFVAVQTGITSATQQPIVTAASRYIPLPNDLTAGLQFIKLGTATQSTTDTVLTLVTKPR